MATRPCARARAGRFTSIDAWSEQRYGEDEDASRKDRFPARQPGPAEARDNRPQHCQTRPMVAEAGTFAMGEEPGLGPSLDEARMERL